MATYQAVIIGAGRMAGTIDDEVVSYPALVRPYSHAAGYAAVPEVELVAFAIIESSRLGGAGVSAPIENREFWMYSH